MLLEQIISEPLIHSAFTSMGVFPQKNRFNRFILLGIRRSLLFPQNTHTHKSIARICPKWNSASTMSGISWTDNHLLEMVIINRLLCVSTEAIPEKLALCEFIDWLETKGSLYSRQDIIRLNRFLWKHAQSRLVYHSGFGQSNAAIHWWFKLSEISQMSPLT